MNEPVPEHAGQDCRLRARALDAGEAQALQEHVRECTGCRQYLQGLQEQSESLVELGREVDTGMTARQDRVIEALESVAPAARRTFPSFGGFIKDCCRGRCLLLGAGITIGRWTARAFLST